MKLSLWLYTHRYGTDVLKILVPDEIELSGKDVVRLTDIDWEGDSELLSNQEEGEGYLSREDEFLEHDIDIPLGDNPSEELKPFVVEWEPE